MTLLKKLGQLAVNAGKVLLGQALGVVHPSVQALGNPPGGEIAWPDMEAKRRHDADGFARNVSGSAHRTQRLARSQPLTDAGR